MKEELTTTVKASGEIEHEYIFTQMKPEDAARVSIRLIKIAGLQVGGALGALQMEPGGIQKDKDIEINMELLGQSLGKMFQQIEEDESIDTFKKLLGSVLYSGKALSLNHPNFQGQTLHMFKVLTEAGRVNFKDFFDESSGVVGTLKNLVTTTLDRVKSSGPTGD